MAGSFFLFIWDGVLYCRHLQGILANADKSAIHCTKKPLKSWQFMLEPNDVMSYAVRLPCTVNKWQCKCRKFTICILILSQNALQYVFKYWVKMLYNMCSNTESKRFTVCDQILSQKGLQDVFKTESKRLLNVFKYWVKKAYSVCSNTELKRFTVCDQILS